MHFLTHKVMQLIMLSTSSLSARGSLSLEDDPGVSALDPAVKLRRSRFTIPSSIVFRCYLNYSFTSKRSEQVQQYQYQSYPSIDADLDAIFCLASLVTTILRASWLDPSRNIVLSHAPYHRRRKTDRKLLYYVAAMISGEPDYNK